MQRGQHLRIRQHVNPLSSSFSVSAPNYQLEQFVIANESHTPVWFLQLCYVVCCVGADRTTGMEGGVRGPLAAPHGRHWLRCAISYFPCFLRCDTDYVQIEVLVLYSIVGQGVGGS